MRGVFASLIRLGNSGKLDLRALIAVGDSLNHAVLSHQEIRQGLIKCQRWGLVKIVNRNYKLTERALTIGKELANTKGGHFSVINGDAAKQSLLAGSLFGTHRDCCKYSIRESVRTCPLAEFFEQFPFEFGTVTGERLEYSPVAM
jgi:hypothetical protein